MLAIEECLNGHNDRGCHRLGQLVGADRVELQGEVGEHHESTERGRERENFEKREALGREDVELGAEK